MRQPQVRNASPDSVLNSSTAMLDRNSPEGTPNCGQDATKPRCLLLRAHSIDISTEPPHSPPTPTPWMKRSAVSSDRAPDADAVIGRHHPDQESGDAHQHQRGDQRRFAAEPVAPMAEDRGADGRAAKPTA